MGKIKNAPKFKNTSFLPDFLFEFWCGVEHNPTILNVDLKVKKNNNKKYYLIY
jgi:hypothetical protein